MSLFMDVHTMGGAIGLADVEQAHQADLRVQGEHGVDYLHYWGAEVNGKIFGRGGGRGAYAADTGRRGTPGLVAGERDAGTAVHGAHGAPQQPGQTTIGTAIECTGTGMVQPTISDSTPAGAASVTPSEKARPSRNRKLVAVRTRTSKRRSRYSYAV